MKSSRLTGIHSFQSPTCHKSFNRNMLRSGVCPSRVLACWLNGYYIPVSPQSWIAFFFEIVLLLFEQLRTSITTGTVRKAPSFMIWIAAKELFGKHLPFTGIIIRWPLWITIFDHGRKEEQIIHLRWGCWLQSGAETTWENWEVDFPDGSECHAWSAHPLLYL